MQHPYTCLQRLTLGGRTYEIGAVVQLGTQAERLCRLGAVEPVVPPPVPKQPDTLPAPPEPAEGVPGPDGGETVILDVAKLDDQQRADLAAHTDQTKRRRKRTTKKRG